MIRKLAQFIVLVFCAAAQAQTAAPFLAQPGGTRNITVTASAQNLTLAASTLAGPLTQIALQTKDVTTGSCTGWVYFRSDGTPAAVNVDMGVRPGVVFVVSVPKTTTQLSVIGDATGCVLYATTGVGP